MKKVFIVLSLSSLIFTACKKNEEIKPTPNPPVITAPVVNKPTNTTPIITNTYSINLVFLKSINKLDYQYDSSNVHIFINNTEQLIKYNSLDSNGIKRINQEFELSGGDSLTITIDSLIYNNNNIYSSDYVVNFNKNGIKQRTESVFNIKNTNGSPVERFIGLSCIDKYPNSPTKDNWYVGYGVRIVFNIK